MHEQVDILVPPMFKPTGEVKSRAEAYRDGDWIGTFNLWIVSRKPQPSIVYQQRSPRSTWAPNLLDVTAGGHFQTGERPTDGLREVSEELGKHYTPKEITFLGRKLYAGFNTNGTSHNNVVSIYMVEDDSPLSSYTLEEREVYALCKCPLQELLKAHHDPEYTFTARALAADGEEIAIKVRKDSFPENWDDYHYKIAILVNRYFAGDRDLIY